MERREFASLMAQNVKTNQSEIDKVLEDSAKVSIAFLATRLNASDREVSNLKAKVAMLENRLAYLGKIEQRIKSAENRIENAAIAFRQIQRNSVQQNGGDDDKEKLKDVEQGDRQEHPEEFTQEAAEGSGQDGEGGLPTEG